MLSLYWGILSCKFGSVFFVGINLLCIYGILKRPVWFIYFFTVLFVQQVYGHGSDIAQQWLKYKTIDWISLLVLLFLPLIFVSLIVDSVKKR